MPTQKSYPHYEINVKDNSIYRFFVEESLPVHRAVWVLPTQEGPIGEPVWVRNATDFMKIFGEETLNEANKHYFTKVSWWLKQLLTMNGQFIVRAANEKGTKYATCIVEAHVKSGVKIPKYYRNADGSTIPVRTSAIDVKESTGSIKTVSQFGKPAVQLSDVDDVESAGQWTDDNGIAMAYPAFKVTPETETGIQITFTIRPASTQKVNGTSEYDQIVENEVDNMLKNVPENDAEGAKVYKLLVIRALYPGDYGNDLRFRFFYKASENDPANTAYYQSVFNCFSAARRDYKSSAINTIVDNFGREYNAFSAKPDAYDRETGIRRNMDSVIESSFESDDPNDPEFPFVIYTNEKALKQIGNTILDNAKEKDGTASLMYFKNLGLEDLGYADWVDFFAKQGVATGTLVDADSEAGYLVNVLSCKNYNGEPYIGITNGDDVIDDNDDGAFTIVDTENPLPVTDITTTTTNTAITSMKTSLMVNTTAAPSAGGNISSALDGAFLVGAIENTIVVDPSASGAQQVVLSKDVDLPLFGGQVNVSGDSEDANKVPTDAYLDRSMYDFVKLHMNPKIVDKFRYPFTHVYDVGYSMTTKYAMIDFLDVRDDVGVELTTQVLLDNSWATGITRNLKVNDQAADIANLLILRERALLMRESILMGTDCMRCSIYTQAGWIPSNTYDDVIPFVFWSAYQHAQYGNLDHMSAKEPRTLPYSENTLFRNWNWMPYSESQKEKTWNAGGNYCQHCDMRRIFYPALRTVYREETSVLLDQWVVDAFIYMKHECRKVWARFTGTNDPQEAVQNAVKKDVEDRLFYLLNGKYTFDVDVYQTEEEAKIGYIEHIKISLTIPSTKRVFVFDIIANRENYSQE